MSVAAVSASGRPRRRRGGGLTVGLATGYLSLIVLLPLAALTWRSTQGGWSAFWDAITDPQAVAALKITLLLSLAVVAVNAVVGTVIAWVLVRDSFPGKIAAQHGHRPALRAPHDRRGLDAARALRAERADRRQRRVHQERPCCSRCCS